MSYQLTFLLASLILILGLAFATVPTQAQDISLSVVFNEVANRDTVNAKYEWIELLIKDDTPDFENWKVSAVTDIGTETTIFKLPKLDSERYGDILLITATDPTGYADHPLAAGFNIAYSADEQPRGIDHTIRYYVADWQNELPNGEFVLVLRSDKSKTNHEAVVDIAGYHSSLRLLPNYPAPDKSNNELAVNSVQQRQHKDIVGTGTKGGNNQDKVAFREQFWTGVGYKRNAQAIDANGGTPGYPNDVLRPSVETFGNVIISEIMYATGDTNLPQWIELKNTSDTVDVDIRNWKLWVTNHSETSFGSTYDGEVEHEINLEGSIPAGQTYLIVARSGMNVARLPNHRLLDVGLDASETLLNSHGFELYLEGNTHEADHKYHIRIDVANNLDLANYARADIPFKPTAWNWPDELDPSGNRVSVVRVSGAEGPIDGESESAWELYNMSGQADTIEDLSYYGHSSDVSSPGRYPGSMLTSRDDDAYGNVIISEIMYATGGNNFPQWIELKNTSEMTDVDIGNWKLWVTNHSENADGSKYGGEVEHEIDLEGTISPGETFLIVARSGTNATNLPSSKILDFGLKRSESLLNPYGFELYLEANTHEADHKYHTRIDVANNLDLKNYARADIPFKPTAWNWPDGLDTTGNRVSVVRTSGLDGPVDGESEDAWELYNMSGQTDLTYYGHNSDISNPGHYSSRMVISGNDEIVSAVTINEIMYATGDSNLPQWIELKNMSKTVEADMTNWTLWVTNHRETADGGTYDGELEHEIDLEGSIQPGQTFLIVSRSGKNGTRLPSHRVLDFGLDKSETLLNPHGFELYLEANTHEADHKYHIRIDVANNLDLKNYARADIPFKPTAWNWPDGLDTTGNRVSVARVSDAKGPVDGESKDAWVLYNMSGQINNIDASTYYGHDSDVSSPGSYPGSSLISNDDDVYSHVIISEIMYATGENELPQWIELKNMSNTVGADMTNWTLWVTNHSETADGSKYDGELEHEIDLEGTIPPKQTFLIVTRSARNTTRLPSHRVLDFGLDKSETLLNPHGFELYLEANTHEADHKYHIRVDVARNLDLENYARSEISFKPTTWNWPDGLDEDGNRVSVVRTPRVDGISEGAWHLYNMSSQMGNVDITYYGHNSDVSSPGYFPGGVLPVTLSKFRPERMKDTGEIVIRWITESETNNAGFNILRSETKNGRFTNVNARLIAGQGTTSERTVYEFFDKTAKPNVVYYYQIQDVSLEGQVQTLRTSRLKGNVTAAGKMTTIWADIKTSDN